MPWLVSRVAMKPLYGLTVFAFLLLGLAFDVCSFAQQEKRTVLRGSDIPHPFYWPLEKKPSVEDIGGGSSRSAIVYIVRLKAGQQLKATMTTKYDKGLLPEPFSLYLFDSKTSSLMGSGTTWLTRVPASPTPVKSPSFFSASLIFASPVSADYYIVPAFQGAGVIFKLEHETTTVIPAPPLTNCVIGPVAKLSYVSSEDDSLISDITVGDPAKAAKPDSRSRRFCLKQACAIRPPTSLVLTYKLQDAFTAKKHVKACWDPDIKEISEVE